MASIPRPAPELPPLPAPGDTALAAACADAGLRMLVLFGSYAPGGLRPRPDSDVDLAFLGNVSTLAAHDLLAPHFLGRTLDIAPLAGADPLFRWEVMQRGVLLAGDPDQFAEYRAYAFRDFVDSADLRALERALSERKLAHLEGLIGASS